MPRTRTAKGIAEESLPLPPLLEEELERASKRGRKEEDVDNEVLQRVDNEVDMDENTITDTDTNTGVTDQADDSGTKKPRARRTQAQLMYDKLNTVLGLLLSSRNDAAVQALEDIITSLDKTKAKREASEYNKFVQKTMPQFKDRVDMSNLQKIQEVARLWKQLHIQAK